MSVTVNLEQRDSHAIAWSEKQKCHENVNNLNTLNMLSIL